MAYQKIITTETFVTQQYISNENAPAPSDIELKTPTFGWQEHKTYEIDADLANHFIETGKAIDFLTEIQNPTLGVPIDIMSVRVESPVQPAPVETAVETVAQAVALDK